MTVNLPSPFKLLAYESLDSTNEEAKRLAEGGAAEGCVIWAREQTAGRGRRGREWVSREGNLYCSILLRPDCHAFKAMQLSFIASLSMAEAVASVLPKGTFVDCKWPNDVLVEGRKISGILLETQTVPLGGMDWLIIGAGLNINHYPEDVEFPATSIKREGGGGVTAEMMIETFSRRFLAGWVTWKNLGFQPARKAWLKRASWLGKEITVRLERETLKGEFRNLDKDGALILLLDGEERRITAGDVFV